jgi:hypothetical protein
MSATIFTKDMFYQHLRNMWNERGFPYEEDKRVGVPIDELVAHSVKRNTERRLPFVDLWIAIFDECISWLISLNTVVYAERPRGEPLTDFSKAVTLILNKIIADSTAIRHLILLGFDTSARTILRSSSEYMEVLVAILHRPEFASEFVNSNTPDAAQKFWQNHLRGGKIRRKVNAAWDDFFRNEHKDVAEWLTNRGRGSSEVLSGLTHPSSAGGLFAAVPLNTTYSDENWLGIWGDKAEISAETIYIYTHFMFPILLLSGNFPFEGYNKYIQRKYDETNELHRQTSIGRSILASLLLSASDKNNAPYVFPELDLSIFRDDIGD